MTPLLATICESATMESEMRARADNDEIRGLALASASLRSEVTRLRSELDKRDEKIRELSAQLEGKAVSKADKKAPEPVKTVKATVVKQNVPSPVKAEKNVKANVVTKVVPSPVKAEKNVKANLVTKFVPSPVKAETNVKANVVTQVVPSPVKAEMDVKVTPLPTLLAAIRRTVQALPEHHLRRVESKDIQVWAPGPIIRGPRVIAPHLAPAVMPRRDIIRNNVNANLRAKGLIQQPQSKAKTMYVQRQGFWSLHT